MEYKALNYLVQAQQADKLMEIMEKKLVADGYVKISEDEWYKNVDFSKLEERVLAHYDNS